MTDISQEARDLLSKAYFENKKPWFAHDILKGHGKQFDVSLRVITSILQK